METSEVNAGNRVTEMAGAGAAAPVEGEGLDREGLKLDELTPEDLAEWGRILDRRPKSLGGQTVAMAMAERLLRVRTREGWTAPLQANAVQQAFERRRGERNIVLKARQMG